MRYQFSILSFTLLLILGYSQISPTWVQSPYIEARTITPVSNNQKTFGNYTITIAFTNIFSSPNILLAIPQLRIVSNSYLNFKSYHSNLAATGFKHNLLIPNSSVVVWYMTVRYLVFNSAILPSQFQAYYLSDQIGSNISVINGQYRTDTFPISLIQPATVTNNPICLVFLAGVSGSSNDYYQLNLTCSIKNLSYASITVTVYISTIINSLSLYMVTWDSISLATQSLYFIDYAISTTYYNSQKTFLLLPYGSINGSYLGGLSSFTHNNNEYLNISLSNYLLSTSLNSFFDSAPQFQIRLRNCNSPYLYYNKGDKLCYITCPSYTFSNTTSFTCNACPVGCTSCLNFAICTACSSNMYVVNSTCICANSSYFYNNACYGCHYSCLTCTTGQYYSCLACDQLNSFRVSVVISLSNFKCECKTGFKDVGITKCSEICGDGNSIYSECDDGNAQSGDGCSNQCIIQANFTCTKNASNFSSCFYIGNVTISLLKIFKQDFQNTALIYLKVQPWIDAMVQLANPESLSSNASYSSVSYDSYKSYLVYKVAYSEPLQGSLARFDLKPTSSGIFSKISPANFTAQLFASDGLELLVYTEDEYQISKTFQYLSKIFGLLILFSAFLYIFGRLKWVGNLLFFSLQFQFMSMIIIPRFTPILNGFGQIKSVMGYNEVLGQQNFDIPKYPTFYLLNFNKKYDLNVNIMVSLQALGLIMYIIYNVTYNKNTVLCKKYGGDPQKSYKSTKHGKLLQFFNWQFFMFWTFFNMTEQITAMILYSEQVQYQFLPLIIFNAVCILFAILPLLFKRKLVKSYTQLLYYKTHGQEQSLLTLICFMLMYGLLAISLTITMMMYYLIFIIPIVMIIYVLCRQPFQSRWVQTAYIINNICIILALMYNLLINAMQDEVFYLPFGSYIIIMFDWIFNIVVWARQAYVICKYGGQRDVNELLESNQKASTKQNQNDFFKQGGNRSAFGNIIKGNNKKLIQQKSSRVPLSRVQRVDDNEMPAGLREEQQQKLDMQQLERQTINKKRQNWLKQESNKPKKIKQLKQRTRSELQMSRIDRSNTTAKIRSTGKKGMDLNKLREIDDITMRYF